MGNFTKKYARKYRPDQSLTLTWDLGYRNLSIYDGKRLVRQWDENLEFIDGVLFLDEKLGEVHIQFGTSRPLQLELTVDGNSFQPDKDGKQEVDVSGPTSLYWALAAFTLVALVVVAIILYREYALFTTASFYLCTYLFTVTGVYILTAFLMSRKRYSGFFIGYSFYTLQLFLFSWVFFLPGDFQWVGILFFLLRLGLFIYLSAHIRTVRYAIKMNEGKQADDILDDQL